MGPTKGEFLKLLPWLIDGGNGWLASGGMPSGEALYMPCGFIGMSKPCGPGGFPMLGGPGFMPGRI